MLLMELSKNIHDGHGPGVLRSEDLQQWKEQRKERMRMAVSAVLEIAEHSKCFTYSHTNSNGTQDLIQLRRPLHNEPKNNN